MGLPLSQGGAPLAALLPSQGAAHIISQVTSTDGGLTKRMGGG